MGVHRIRRFRRQGSGLLRDASGATAIEYTLVVAMLAVAVIGSMQILQEPLVAMFAGISSAFTSAR